MTAPHRVLVADDSATTRTLLSSVLDADPRLAVIGHAVDGLEAVRLTTQLRPTIVVMDIEMPHMDGLEATRRIMVDQPTPIVIVTAGYDADRVGLSLQATRAGALTIAPKPSGPSSATFRADTTRLVKLVTALADVKVVRQHDRRGDGAPASPPAAADRHRAVDVVGVVASTGGPAVLYQLLQLLPPTLDVPVLIVQHIADGFVDGLAKWLGAASALPVVVATDGHPARGGEVYIAPDDRHLCLTGGHLHLSSDPPVGGFRPSGTEMLASLAASHGAAAAAVVMTGMGRDGLEGAAQVRAAGGLVLAQDAATSAVFGMPGVVVDAGLAHLVGSVDVLAAKISMFAAKRKS